MISKVSKIEDVVNNSNQPQNGKSRVEILRSKHPKGKTMDDIQFFLLLRLHIAIATLILDDRYLCQHRCR